MTVTGRREVPGVWRSEALGDTVGIRGLEVQGLKFEVDLKCKVWSLEFGVRIWDLRFGAWGFELEKMAGSRLMFVALEFRL